MSARLTRRSRPRLDRLEARLAPSLTPVGPEFQVNTFTTAQQWQPKVASSADGDFVIAYMGYDNVASSTDWGVFARLYDADGTPLVDPFLVAEVPSFYSIDVSVAMDAAGDFVVVWSTIQDINNPEPWTIMAKRYDSAGSAIGTALQVNSPSIHDCMQPDVAMNANGDFAIAWLESTHGTSPFSGIFYRAFAADGTPTVAQTRVESNSQFASEEPAIGISANGTVAIARQSETAVWGHLVIVGRVFDPAGQPLGPDFNAFNGLNPDLDMTEAGDFLLTGWLARRYSSNGTPQSDVLYYPGVHFLACALLPDGGFVAGSPPGDVLLRRFDASNVPDGDAVLMNTYTADQQYSASVCTDADGDGVVVWQSLGQDGSAWGVFARRFSGAAPTPFQPQVNGGGFQRSTITSTAMSFTRVLTLPAASAAAFELTGPAGSVPVAVSLAGSTPAGSQVTLTFPGQPGGSLPDGRYTLRVLASQVTDSAGQHLDGNGDGVPGDDFVMTFHRLLGDFDGDADVDARDYGAFRTAFGSAALTFDLDGDGDVDAADLGVFRGQFGASV